MSKISIITYTSGESKDLVKTERSIKIQYYRDYEWVLLNNEEICRIPDCKYILFLKPGEILIGKETLQKVFAQGPTEDIVFGNAIVKKPLMRHKKVGPLRDDISIFNMMENPIPLSSAFINRSVIDNLTITSDFVEPTHWLELLLKVFFLDNCTLKHTGIAVSEMPSTSYKTMFNIDNSRQNEIIQTIMPRLTNTQNRLYSQSETNEALKLFFFLQRNKIAQYLYNRFLKAKGGLDA